MSHTTFVFHSLSLGLPPAIPVLKVRYTGGGGGRVTGWLRTSSSGSTWQETLRHRLCLVCSTASLAKTLPLSRAFRRFGGGDDQASGGGWTDTTVKQRARADLIQGGAVDPAPTVAAVLAPFPGSGGGGGGEQPPTICYKSARSFACFSTLCRLIGALWVLFRRRGRWGRRERGRDGAISPLWAPTAGPTAAAALSNPAGRADHTVCQRLRQQPPVPSPSSPSLLAARIAHTRPSWLAGSPLRSSARASAGSAPPATWLRAVPRPPTMLLHRPPMLVAF